MPSRTGVSLGQRNGKGRRRSDVEGRLKIPSIRYREGSRRTLIYVRRCNICAKRRRRSEEGGRPCRVSPSYFLPTVAKERGCTSLSPHPTRNPAFPVSSLPWWGKQLSANPSSPIRRERENPRPFTGLLAVAAVSYLGLRGAPLYRRTATLGSPPHLLYSVSYSLSFRLGLTLPRPSSLRYTLVLRPFLC